MKSQQTLWFSRHAPTQDQFAMPIPFLGGRSLDVPAPIWSLDVTPEATAMACMTIESESDLASVVLFLRKAVSKYAAIAGVFPSPLLGVIAGDSCREYHALGQGLDSPRCVSVFSAWNIQRAVEGGAPTFQHYKWVKIGLLCTVE